MRSLRRLLRSVASKPSNSCSPGCFSACTGVVYYVSVGLSRSKGMHSRGQAYMLQHLVQQHLHRPFAEGTGHRVDAALHNTASWLAQLLLSTHSAQGLQSQRFQCRSRSPSQTTWTHNILGLQAVRSGVVVVANRYWLLYCYRSRLMYGRRKKPSNLITVGLSAAIDRATHW